MAMPDLSLEEKLLLKMIKSGKISEVSSDPAMWGHLVGAAALAMIAFAETSVLIMAGALVISCGYTVYRTWQHDQWGPHWTSLIEKLEAGCLTNSSDAKNPQPEAKA